MSLKRESENGNNALSITEAEAELYDRQIRLWGLDAQKRLRASCILVIGMNGVGAEICKNLILSGVKALTMIDPHPVTEEDFLSQFLIAREELGKNRAEASLQRARELNPMVQVTADNDDIENKSKEFFDDFDVIVATGCSSKTITKLNNVCNTSNIKFYAADVFGFYGYMFADLGKHRYVEEQKKAVQAAEEPLPKKKKLEETETTMVEKFTEFYRFKDAMCCKFDEKTPIKTLKRVSSVYFMLQAIYRFMESHGRIPRTESAEQDTNELEKIKNAIMVELKLDKTIVDENFAKYCMGTLSPACAIIGGVAGQEIVKAVSGKDKPLNNFFFYDGLDGNGMVECFK